MQEKDSWDWSSSQKIAGAMKKKDQGNNLFKNGKLFHAAKKYEKVGYNLLLIFYLNSAVLVCIGINVFVLSPGGKIRRI